MNTLLQHIVARTYKPLLVKYLSKTRRYRYKDIRLDIPPQVFHPRYFFSTALLLQYIDKLELGQKNFLELGCGSGLIAIAAAKKGAVVTATDINTVAVDSLKSNSIQNNVCIKIIASDLFLNIPSQQFDVIAINPPYYKRQPLSAADYAWFCGEHGEYFMTLFATLENYIHASTQVLMVLFNGCDTNMIGNFAAENNFVLSCVHRKKNMLEENFIYSITKKS